MVYRGPSRGCITCRTRRKKCDETRPSCLRCLKSRRPCCGYDTTNISPVSTILRQGSFINPQWPPPSLLATARKCSIPRREPFPGSNGALPNDTIPFEASNDDSNILALRCFVYEFCTSSANQNLSRGYLHGLDVLSDRFHTHGDMAKACRTVTFACRGKTLNRPSMVRKAEGHYRELLTSLARKIQRSKSIDDPELTVIAMALGLCQIMLADQFNPGEHDAHAKGLSVFLTKGQFGGDQLLHHQSCFSAEPHSGILSRMLSVPSLKEGNCSLANFVIDVNTLWSRYENSTSSDQVGSIRKECIALDKVFSEWADARKDYFKPTVVGEVKPSNSFGGVGTWPGNIDTYFDFYVAGAWNGFRIARLLLVDLIIELSDPVSAAEYVVTGQRTAQDLAASVPYHLAESLPEYLRSAKQGQEISKAQSGKVLGGLILMHPLYIASRMRYLSPHLQEYFRVCLEWIGDHMGIGQATLLSRDPNIDRDYLASGWLIIWSGFIL